MPDAPVHYWDACVFLDYINETKDRVNVIADLLAQSARGEIEIVTSTMSIVEVAFSYAERASKGLDPKVEEALDALWADRKTIKMVDMHQLVCHNARALVRRAVEKGESLRPHDAVHLATAELANTTECSTYDERLQRKAHLVSFPIREPFLHEPTLGLS